METLAQKAEIYIKNIIKFLNLKGVILIKKIGHDKIK